MTSTSRPPLVIERRPIAGRRFAAKPDDLNELRAVIATMRDVPRESLESFADMLHLLRRLSGRLDRIADRLEVAGAPVARKPRTRLAAGPAADQAAIIAGVFGKGRTARPARELTRTVVSRKCKRVSVVERSAGQLEMMV